MRLMDLEPKFYRFEERDGTCYHVPVGTLAEAQGVRFLCPKCFAANGGAVGTHGIICWSRSRGVPESAHPGPGRWRMDGTGIDDLTLNAEQPGGKRSVELLSGCRWHGFVTYGGVADA